MLLDGKVAVITGAGGALGAAMAIRFIEEGAKLVLTDVSQPRLDSMLKDLNVGARAIAVVADATSADDTEKIVVEATKAEQNFQQPEPGAP